MRLSTMAAALWIADTTGLAAGQMELVSRVDPSQSSDTGAGAERPPDPPTNSLPAPPSLSADGRYLVFLSRETNLVPGQQDMNRGPDVFLKDLVTGTLAGKGTVHLIVEVNGYAE